MTDRPAFGQRPCPRCKGLGTAYGESCGDCEGRGVILPTTPLRCTHSNVEIAKAILDRDGRISAYDAVYQVACPFDGITHRNTRLAATIWTLRHKHGYDIETQASPGMLALYVLRP